MTNNPDKVRALEDYGLAVSERMPIEIAPRQANRKYLQTKRAKFGHLLSLVAEQPAAKAGKQAVARKRK
jgi:3,4-dihydroxy 2-butanone 4-phosphate synthase / GTP cyclohydrolase II